MPDDTDAHLLRSLEDERQYVLLPRLEAMKNALLLISALTADPTHAQKLRTLVEIHKVAEEALLL